MSKTTTSDIKKCIYPLNIVSKGREGKIHSAITNMYF